MISKLTQPEIFEKFATIVASSLRIERSRVTMDSHIMNDLGAESLDLIEITMESESAFNIWLPEKSILDTATEVFGPGVLVRDGILTETGKDLLRQRLPPEIAPLFEGEVSVRDLQSYFLTVRSWVALIDRLLQHTPVTCDACGGALQPGVGFRLRCTECQKEVSLQSGEDLNRAWVRQYYDEEFVPAQEGAQQATPTGAASH
jgi:acyl carrier protein